MHPSDPGFKDYIETVRHIDGLAQAVHWRECYFDEAQTKLKSTYSNMTPGVAAKIYAEFREAAFLMTSGRDYADAEEWLDLMQTTLADIGRILLKDMLTIADPSQLKTKYHIIQIEAIIEFIQHGLNEIEAGR